MRPHSLITRLRWSAGLLLLVLCGVWASSTAQTTAVNAVVRGVEARYHGARTLQATFLERYAEGRTAVRVESGEVYFSRPNRMRWDYTTPETKMFLVDGVNVWFYVPADRTATRTRIKESDDWQTPLALLLGRVRLSRICGRVELANLQAGPGAAPPAAHVLRCTPRGRQSPFNEVLLEVDADYWITRVVIREAGAVETEFRFANWRSNVDLPEVMFHFAAPPGVAIVDESSIAGPIR